MANDPSGHCGGASDGTVYLGTPAELSISEGVCENMDPMARAQAGLPEDGDEYANNW